MSRVEQPALVPDQSANLSPTPDPIKLSGTSCALEELLRHADPGRLLECYYWSQEPGLLEFVRATLASPPDVRMLLQAFFTAAVVRKQITASVDTEGSLNLHSVEAAAILTQFFPGHSSESGRTPSC